MKTPSSPFASLVSYLTPPLVFPPEDYDGLQFRYGRFVFRPAEFKAEGYILVVVVLYALFYFLASSYNTRKANKWFNAHHELLSAQFSSPGETNTLLADGSADMFQFSTGRRNIASLHTVFSFVPRHDFFQLLITYGWTLYDLRYQPQDEVLLDFTLHTGAPTVPHFVWALVDKDELITIKNRRWDLTLTKTQENSAVPKETAVMTEVADVSDSILKSAAAVNFLTVLRDPKVLKLFKSLSISDLPTERPANGPVNPSRKQRHVYLSLHLPSGSTVEDSIPLVAAVFTLIDFLESHKFTVRSETTRKLRIAREELDKELLKDVQADKKEAEEDKRTQKRKAEEERIAKLSAEQQRKILEKEKKRAQRKGTKNLRIG